MTEKPEMTVTLLICGNMVTVTAEGIFMINGEDIFHASNIDNQPSGVLTMSVGNANRDQIKFIHNEYAKHYSSVKCVLDSSPNKGHLDVVGVLKKDQPQHHFYPD